ncbi:MAG: PEP-CTERM sorting domain-containing protein [Azonexus sp.]|jgi:hypothetical protein|nr:PEP-CTERM sorting domain-containing protein [Azonexus sp.]
MILVFVAAQAQASIVVGSHNGPSCYPFSCFASDGGIVFQQVYDSSAFSEAFDFNNVSFFLWSDGIMDSATYTISFSTTSNPVLGLDADYSNNIGADNVFFGTYSLSGSMPSVLSLAGNMFHYDPLMGNLLMHVVVDFVDSSGNFPMFWADYFGVSTSILVVDSWGTDNTIGALVTQFGLTETAVPEPNGIWLLGLALLGVVCHRKYFSKSS